MPAWIAAVVEEDRWGYPGFHGNKFVGKLGGAGGVGVQGLLRQQPSHGRTGSSMRFHRLSSWIAIDEQVGEFLAESGQIIFPRNSLDFGGAEFLSASRRHQSPVELKFLPARAM